jgi:hypothetical protein
VEYTILDDHDLTDDQLSHSIDFESYDWFYHVINEIGEKGGPLKYLSRSPFYEIEFNISQDEEPIIYVFKGRISEDLLHAMFHPKDDISLGIKNSISRGDTFRLVGYMMQCIFEIFRQNKHVKRVVFIADNDRLERFHDTMVTWIPKRYKELKFMEKEHGNKPSYWYEKVQLTKEDFRYTVNW